jgi:hypothetical protein
MINFIKRLLGFGKKNAIKEPNAPKKKKAIPVISTNYKTAFDKQFWQNFKSEGKLLKQDIALEIAKDIRVNLVHNSTENKHHEIKIINHLQGMGYKSHISVISFIFFKLYSMDLLNEIENSFDKGSFRELTKSITNLPD